MGSPTLRRALLLLPTAFLLTSLPAAPGTYLPLDHPQITTNFACRAKVYGAIPKPRCQQKSWEGPALSVPTLALSTVQLCPHKCQPCVRVRLALNATGIEGLELHFLVLNSNRSIRLQVFRRRKRRAGSGTLWQLQFDCFTAESGQWVFVWLETLPSRMLVLNQSLQVINERSGPKFHYTWMPADRVIEVSVPEGPNVTVRLCHQLALECEELHHPFHKQALVSRHQPAVLPYEYLLPCLCIEASYEHRDSQRKKKCPFQDQPEACSTPQISRYFPTQSWQPYTRPMFSKELQGA